MRETERKIESVIKEWLSSDGWTIVANTPDVLAYKGRDGDVNISAIARCLSDELAAK